MTPNRKSIIYFQKKKKNRTPYKKSHSQQQQKIMNFEELTEFNLVKDHRCALAFVVLQTLLCNAICKGSLMHYVSLTNWHSHRRATIKRKRTINTCGPQNVFVDPTAHCAQRQRRRCARRNGKLLCASRGDRGRVRTQIASACRWVLLLV